MDNLITLILNIAFGITVLSLMISFIRLLKGPTPSDRAVALDAMTVVGISIIVFLSYYFQRVIYLDIAVVYGLLSFLGVIAIARYLEGGL